MLQQVSTPSIIHIDDNKILASDTHSNLDVVTRDAWTTVLSQLNIRALDASSIIGALDNAFIPSSDNPFVTHEFKQLRFESRGLVLIGTVGSNADFEGDDDSVVNDAISFLQSKGYIGGTIAFMPGTYTFSNTVSLPTSVAVLGAHPTSVIIVGDSDFPLFNLADKASLKFISLENEFAVNHPLVKMAGDNSVIAHCIFKNYPLLAVQMLAAKATILSSYFFGSSSAIWLQNLYQLVEKCSFYGQHTHGVLKFESSSCSVLANYMDTSTEGAAYLLPSPKCVNNKLVANHLGSSISIDLAIDLGTKTVKYANTPDSLKVNENNFLLSLQKYTGQPNLASDTMVLSNHAAHDASIHTNAATILSSLDLFTQYIYSERSWFLTSATPTFDVNGNPTSGVFSWASSTLSWPNFSLHSLVPNKVWNIQAGSIVIPEGYAFVLDVDWQSLVLDILPVVKPCSLELTQPSDMHQLVVAFSPSTSVLVWTKGFRILTTLTSFDVDGHPLPLLKFVGNMELRNTQLMPATFAQGHNITDKISSQTSLLNRLYEDANTFEYSNFSIDTMPSIGGWLQLTSNKPGLPSHILQLKGTTYALFPSAGLYRWYRDNGSGIGVWGLISGNPLAQPFAAISKISTSSILILKTTGELAAWNSDNNQWVSYSGTTLLTHLPLPHIRPTSFLASGQSDFIFQSPYYSLFSLVDGRTLLYFYKQNMLVETYRVFTEGLGGRAFLGRHFKDTGFNVTRHHWSTSINNGTFSTLQGLPMAKVPTTSFSIAPQVYKASLAAVKWDMLRQENFSFDQSSHAFTSVLTDDVTNFYILAGGLNNAHLLAHVIIGQDAFSDFTPHGWLINNTSSEILAFGATVSTKAFTVILGQVNTITNDDLQPIIYNWTKQILGSSNSNLGSVGVLDSVGAASEYNILASDGSRSNRPTWWRYNRILATWQQQQLAEGVVPQAVANSFSYTIPTDRSAGYGIATSSAIYFLARDASRASRPTLWIYDRSTYSAIRLSEAAAPYDALVLAADTGSVTQFYGGIYQNGWNALVWSSRHSSSSRAMLFFYFISTNSWHVMSLGLGGSHLGSLNFGTPPFFRRSGSLVSTPTLTPFIDAPVEKDIYIWSQNLGMLKGSITAYFATGVVSASSWQVHDNRLHPTMPIFSPTSTYSATVGVSRSDLSIQIGSFAEKTLPIFGASDTTTLSNGLLWFDAGSYVKQATQNIWLGINRGGYLWIGNLAVSNIQQELTPSMSIVRGDIVLANLGSCSEDFDYAFNSTKSQIAIVYRDAANNNRLAFLLYDIASNSVILERGGASGVISLGSQPRIEYNQFNNSWSIVAQDATTPTANARLMYFRRLVTSSTWIEEIALPSGSGKLPSKPLHLSDGMMVIATEHSTSFDLCLSSRTVAGAWATIYTSSGGGFKSPSLVKTLDNTSFWVFGSVRVALSTNLLSGWTIFLPTPTLAHIGYSRVSADIALLSLDTSIVVATSAAVDGTTPAGRELLIWNFSKLGQAYLIGAFTAKGRLQSSEYSGEEEDGIAQLSWTYDNKLLYSAIRPTRTLRHWSIRSSTTNWQFAHGDSLLGSGRYITLGGRHFREQWGSTVASGGSSTGTNLIIEYPSTTAWPSLPLALRHGETDFLSVKWPYLTSTSHLFTIGSMSTGLVDDTTLAVAALPTSATRLWPIILGNTRIQGINQVGSSVFGLGSMLGLFAPASHTNASYFGIATIASDNLFKLDALPAINLRGTRIWRFNASEYISSDTTFLIDTSTAALYSHLVLNFNIAASLRLDTSENPLSYWLEYDRSNTTRAIVLAEIHEQDLILYPSIGSRSDTQVLTFGHLEPVELLKNRYSWTYSLPYIWECMPNFTILYAEGSVLTIQEIGSLRGIQNIELSSTEQVAIRRLLPHCGWYFFCSDVKTATSEKIYVLATRTGNVIALDKLHGKL